MVRQAATNALAAIGRPVVAHLVDVFRTDNEGVRRAAMKALRKMGSSAVEALKGALGDSDPEVCYHATVALGDIGDSSAIDSLLDCLTSENVELRYGAAEALGKLKAEEAIPELERMMEQDQGITKWNKQVAQAAKVALTRISKRR